MMNNNPHEGKEPPHSITVLSTKDRNVLHLSHTRGRDKTTLILEYDGDKVAPPIFTLTCQHAASDLKEALVTINGVEYKDVETMSAYLNDDKFLVKLDELVIEYEV